MSQKTVLSMVTGQSNFCITKKKSLKDISFLKMISLVLGTWRHWASSIHQVSTSCIGYQSLCPKASSYSDIDWVFFPYPVPVYWLAGISLLSTVRQLKLVHDVLGFMSTDRESVIDASIMHQSLYWKLFMKDFSGFIGRLKVRLA